VLDHKQGQFYDVLDRELLQLTNAELHMGHNGKAVVTGALGFTGRRIAHRLLQQGTMVTTLTRRTPRESPFGSAVEFRPLCFDREHDLVATLQGADTLYNTYWVRFEHGATTFDRAIRNTQALLTAAKRAGVRRVVHVSITNPSRDSHLPYFRGKAVLEDAVVNSGLSFAILRPTVVFGDGDILINNIAWFLRHLPVFVVPGSGSYRVQPVYVEDLAAIAVDAGATSSNVVIDAVGPEVFSFTDLVREIRTAIKSRAALLHLHPNLALFAARALGVFVQDVVLTKDEIGGLMAELLVSSEPPTGATRFGQWTRDHAGTLGVRYASELQRHYR
jgi:NADH dehydrogenase